MHVGVVAGGGDQTGLAQSLERVAQLRQPTSQAAAGRVADPHVLDQFRRAESALVQIGNRLAVAVQLHAIETRGFVQQRWQAAPLTQQRQSLRELHLVIEFGKANHVAAAATAVAVEQALAGIHQEAGLVIVMQRTQPHQSAAAESPGRPPIMGLQVVQQGNLLFQLVESLATHGLLASMGRIRRIAVQSQARMVGEHRGTPADGLPELRRQQGSHMQQASGPASHGRWVRRPRCVGDVRNGSFPATVGSAQQLPGLLPAMEAVDAPMAATNRAAP